MRFFGAALVLAVATTANAECLCGENSFFYTTVDPADAEFMEDFVWEVKRIEPIYDLRTNEDTINSCRVEVTFVHEDNPALDTLDLSGESEPILFGGIWLEYAEFEQAMLVVGCTPLLS
jgi:hypothetical protein